MPFFLSFPFVSYVCKYDFSFTVSHLILAYWYVAYFLSLLSTVKPVHFVKIKLDLWIAVSVDANEPCTNMSHDPVCDTVGGEHPNICYLIRYQRTLAYTGPCLVSP